MLTLLLDFVSSDQSIEYYTVTRFGDDSLYLDSDISVIDFPMRKIISFFDGDLSKFNFTVIRGNATEKYQGKDFKNVVGFFKKEGEEAKLIIERSANNTLTFYHCSGIYFQDYDLYVSSIPNKSVRFFKDLTYDERTNILLCKRCEYKLSSNKSVPTFDELRNLGVIMPFYGSREYPKIFVTTYEPFGKPFSGQFKGSKTTRFVTSNDFTERWFYLKLCQYFVYAFTLLATFCDLCIKDKANEKENSEQFLDSLLMDDTLFDIN